MDILYLLDRLEEALTSGIRLPFGRALINEQECLDILDQIRVAIPEEVRQARQMNAQREALLADASKTAQQTIQEAQERAARLVKENSTVRAAETMAAEVRAAAYREAEEIRRGADEYAYGTLAALETQVDQILRSVRRGLQELESLRELDSHSYHRKSVDDTRS